ncbi:MAG: amidohydrolase family protein [Acidimicrobiales bacterium]
MIEATLSSADSHFVEPPDIFERYLPRRLHEQAPRMELQTDGNGISQHVWTFEGNFVTPLGGGAPRRGAQDQGNREFRALWSEIDPAAYDPNAYADALRIDGVGLAIVQPTTGLVLWRVPDSELLTALFRAQNDHMVDFCSGRPDMLKGVACLNVDDVSIACAELRRCRDLGLVAALIPVHPGAAGSYSDPRYDELWATAQELESPLFMHVATVRPQAPTAGGMSTLALSPGLRSVREYWVRLSLADIIFGRVFDRFPRLRVGSVEHEAGWVPFWLDTMDWTYTQREVLTGGWRSASGQLPSEIFRTNMFATFIEDELAVELRRRIGVDNLMWGNDFPHTESSWPESRGLVDKLMSGVSEADRALMTSGNVTRLLGLS